MNRTKLFIAIGGVLALVIISVWFLFPRTAVSPESSVAEEGAMATSTENPASTTPKTPAKATPKPFLSISPLDTIASWSLHNSYTDDPTHIAKVNAEIVRLNGLIGTGEYSDYTLYVSLANQYDLLGDGDQEFAYLKKALAIDSTTTGLAWHNAGQLLARLGAYTTARTAFEQAVLAQPEITQYHVAFADFLKAHFPQDTAAIAREEAAVNSTLGKPAQ